MGVASLFLHLFQHCYSIHGWHHNIQDDNREILSVKFLERLDTVDQRLATGGRIVLNAITMDTLTAANEYFGNAGYAVEVVTVNIARTRPLSDYKMIEAYNLSTSSPLSRSDGVAKIPSNGVAAFDRDLDIPRYAFALVQTRRFVGCNFCLASA